MTYNIIFAPSETLSHCYFLCFAAVVHIIVSAPNIDGDYEALHFASSSSSTYLVLGFPLRIFPRVVLTRPFGLYMCAWILNEQYMTHTDYEIRTSD